MFISLLIGPISSHNGENRDDQKMQGRTTDEKDDPDQETIPPKTTNSITRIPHLIWVMGRLSYALYVRKMYHFNPKWALVIKHKNSKLIRLTKKVTSGHGRVVLYGLASEWFKFLRTFF